MEALWSLFRGGLTEDDAAIRIQRAYRSHRQYELAWRLDVIQGRRPCKDNRRMDLVLDIVATIAERDFWREQRNLIKNDQHWVVVPDEGY